MTVATLTDNLTIAEMIKWSQYFRQSDPNQPEEVDWTDPANISRMIDG